MSEIDLPSDLLRWVEDVAAGPIVHADRIPGGGRKEGWHVDIGADGVEQPTQLFLRYDRSDPATTKDPWTVHREARFYLALQGSAVPVADVLGVHPVHQAMLCERLIGANWFSRIEDPAEAEATAKDFMMKLAALHRIDTSAIGVVGLEVPATVAEAVAMELDELEEILSLRGGEPDPALRFSLDWLRRNVPSYDGPVVIVQGDTGPGNFMYDAGRVVAVVDWELAHFGDPMDDVAWLTLRCTQEPLPDLPARLREYEEHSGVAVDETRVRYYQVMAEVKLQVMGHRPPDGVPRASTGGGLGADLGNGLIYAQLHRRLWLEALTDAVGLDRDPAEVPPDPVAGDHTWLYGALLDQLRVVAPRIDDPLAKQRTKGFARVVKVLAATDAHGSFYDACELDDLTGFLGQRPASLAAGRRAAADAARSGQRDVDYLRYLWKRVARGNELARAAMGALADRHWPALR